MQIAIVSDSHYAIDRFSRLLPNLREDGVLTLIHAGDFFTRGIEIVIADFPDIQFYMARGNCDSDRELWNSLRRLPHVCLEDIVVFELEGIRFIVSHIPGVALNTLNRKDADVVIHGHTHLARVEKVKQTLILNPGSLMDGDGYMILDVPSLKVDRRFIIR